MGKATAEAGDSALRSIPSVDRILSAAAFGSLISEFGRARVKDAIVEHLVTLRASRSGYDETRALVAVGEALATSLASTLRRVINGSGVIIHTNLGRSPIGAEIWSGAAEVTGGYSNLEFDVEEGQRGARDEHLRALCASLFGAEDAILANNNAAAALLLLAALAPGREVLVSRGELVEIGGSFRVPDVIQQGGAKLREVGTTNRTRAGDYAEAASKRTAAILRVHRSNFEIVGFTETPSIDELVEVSRKAKVPLLYDEGTGRVVDLASYGFAPSETIGELLAKGVDVVTCSTDKLIGATQGGLLLGDAELIGRCRRHPLMRALRAGKESYAVIGETLRAFAVGRHEQRVPIYRMLAATLEELRARGASLIAGTACRLTESRCALGGGTTPAETIPSVAVEVPGNANELHARFLRHEPPIVGRIVEDRFTIEVRTLSSDDVAHVRSALQGTAPAG